MARSDSEDPVDVPSRPELTKRMTSIIEYWNREGDRRVIFLSCYTLMTGNMLVAVREGEFQDAEWVTRLVHHFADYYFKALDAYDSSAGNPPAVWRLTHDAAFDPETKVLQNLLLGVNAHINYDLAQAVTDLLAPEWQDLSEKEREARYDDYCYVNRIIAETIDTVQDQVVEHYSPIMDVVDIVLGPFDELFTSRMIDHWREEVWQHVVDMLESQQADRRERMCEALEAAALDKARLISKA